MNDKYRPKKYLYMIKLTKKLEYSLMILKYIEDNGQIGPISARQVTQWPK